MANIIQVRRDTAANWTSANPVLAQGEPGLETDTLKLKFGDGSTAWNSLDYYSAGDTSPVTFEALNGNGDVGTGADQVAAGNHTHNQYLVDVAGNSIDESKLAPAYKTIEVVSGTVLDWANMGGTITLTADTTFTFSNLRKGVYFLETTGDYSVSFPSGFNYAGGERASSGTTLYQIVNTSGTGGWYVILKTES